MLPLVSFFALLPLALALRVPTALDATVTIPDVKVDLTHGLALGTDASAVAAGGTTPFSKRQLNLVPAIQAGTSFCVTLSADLEVDDDGVDVTLDAGTCLCFDAQVEALGTSGPLTVVASTGETFTGDVAAKLRLSVRLPPLLDPFTYISLAALCDQSAVTTWPRGPVTEFVADV